ncbi:MAG: hypothetical protein KDA88_12175 [Planctomycetaceae bacterium]|nr:hypothetical protein [Planctomycetaceae bacterium]MCB9954112.1 hypothetical protein [Planctomycetaceae bacterium]
MNREAIIIDSFQSALGDGNNQTVEYTTGERIPLGPVSKVYISEEHYIVYSDQDGFFWYNTDKALGKPSREFNDIWNQVQSVRSLPRHNAEAVMPAVDSSLATAVGCAFEGDFDSSRKAIEQARSVFLEECERQAKSLNMLVTSIAALSTSTIGMVFFFNLVDSGTSSAIALAKILSASIAGGSIGVLLSVLGPNPSNVRFDPFATRSATIIDGVLRVVYGMVTALVVTLATEIGLVTSTVLTNDKTTLAILIVAIAGGFLERWAVDIIRKVRPAEPVAPPTASPVAPPVAPPAK